MVSSIIMENLARFISGSITSLTSLPTFAFLADDFRGGNLSPNK